MAIIVVVNNENEENYDHKERQARLKISAISEPVA